MIPSVYPRFCLYLHYYWGFPGSSAGNESTCNAEEPGLILGSGKSPGEGIGYPLQYSWASLVAQMVKNLPAMQETWVRTIPWRRAGKACMLMLLAKSSLYIDLICCHIAGTLLWLADFYLSLLWLVDASSVHCSDWLTSNLTHLAYLKPVHRSNTLLWLADS